jgi:hypothetical protein
MCLSRLIYTVRPRMNHTSHAMAMPMPRPCRALTMTFFSRPRHSTAVERRPVGHLPAFGFFRLPREVPRRLSEAYHSYSQRSIPTTVKSGSSTLQKKDDLLNCWTSSSDISGYHADFHEGHGTIGARQGRGMAWRGNGMGVAWARHAICESAFTVLCLSPINDKSLPNSSGGIILICGLEMSG